jgi:hypothetical protein
MTSATRGAISILLMLVITVPARSQQQPRSSRSGSNRAAAQRAPAAQRPGSALRSNRSSRTPAPEPPDPRAEEAVKALSTVGGLQTFARNAEKDLLPLLASPTDNADLIIRLTTWREFGRYFGRIASPAPAELESLRWLATKPKTRTALMLAVSNADSPDAVLKVLSALQHDQQDVLEQFPDLTAAMCVVWDIPRPRGPVADRNTPSRRVDLNRPLLLMRYYTTMRRQLQIDPQELPWELAVYIAANEITDGEEALWALNRYGNRAAIGGVFFDVDYDYDKYGGGTAHLDKRPYTLPNLQLYGGICEDQAYYATQVARCCGVPAVVATGVNANEGTGHAWVGYLNTARNGIFWNFEEGRYPENRYWQGNIIDPQTGERITDADVSILAELSNSTPQNRNLATALTKASSFAPSDTQANLLMQAINLSAGNRAAWLQLAALGKANRLSPQQLAQLHAAVTRFAVNAYPDFAFDILTTASAGRGSDEQMAALQEMNGMFPNRPDLQAAVATARGDLLHKEKRNDEALTAYGEVLNRYLNVAPIVNETMQRVDRMLREARALPKLADIYEVVWKRLPTPESSVAVQGTPFYRIGARYRDLLNDLGEEQEAKMVEMRLQSLTASMSSRQPPQQ